MVDCTIRPQDMSGGNIITELLDMLEIKNGRNVNSFKLKGEWRYSQAKVDEIVKNGEEIIISQVPFRPNHVRAGGEIKKMKNVLSPTHYNMETNEDATAQIIELMGTNVFDNPKPVKLIHYLIRAVTYDTSDAIILDFFSGSWTTAHAVMKLNAEDGGRRKFIMVQLPEDISERLKRASDAESFTLENAIALCNKLGKPHLLSEIGKERIRRSGENVTAPLAGVGLDTGFRVLKLDETNMKEIYYSPAELRQANLLDSVDNIKPDRSPLDILFGVMIDWGLLLSLPISEKKFGKNTIFVVGDNDLAACFDIDVSDDLVREIATLKPTRAVFRDASFARDDAKINAVEMFKTICGWDNDDIRQNFKVI